LILDFMRNKKQIHDQLIETRRLMYNMTQNTKVQFFETGLRTDDGSTNNDNVKLMPDSYSPPSKIPKYTFLA
jgi:hypothetical protein